MRMRGMRMRGREGWMEEGGGRLHQMSWRGLKTNNQMNRHESSKVTVMVPILTMT